jgi:hypothetical protein
MGVLFARAFIVKELDQQQVDYLGEINEILL